MAPGEDRPPPASGPPLPGAGVALRPVVRVDKPWTRKQDEQGREQQA